MASSSTSARHRVGARVLRRVAALAAAPLFVGAGCASSPTEPSEWARSALAEVVVVDRAGAPAVDRSVIVVLLDELPDASGAAPRVSLDVAQGRTDARGVFVVADVDDERVVDWVRSHDGAAVNFQAVAFAGPDGVWVCSFARSAAPAESGSIRWVGPEPTLQLFADGRCVDSTVPVERSSGGSATTAAGSR